VELELRELLQLIRKELRRFQNQKEVTESNQPVLSFRDGHHINQTPNFRSFIQRNPEIQNQANLRLENQHLRSSTSTLVHPLSQWLTALTQLDQPLQFKTFISLRKLVSQFEYRDITQVESNLFQKSDSSQVSKLKLFLS
jgi:hypothetical protein